MGYPPGWSFLWSWRLEGWGTRLRYFSVGEVKSMIRSAVVEDAMLGVQAELVEMVATVKT